MSQSYDAAIIGGGLAGCAAAIRVLQRAPNARVLLLERGRYPRQKVCGEFVSAEGVALLREFSRESEPLERLLRSAAEIPRARLHAMQHTTELPVSPAALSISRYELDAALWRQAATLGADCRQESAVKKIEGSGPFTLRASDGEFRASAVINASGRWSAISAAPAAAKNGHHWIGLKAHYREPAPEKCVELYFFAHGYCGVQPAGENTVNACAMVRADAATTLNEVFALHPALGARSRRWIGSALMEPVATAPLVFRKPEPVARRMFNAGDAAGFIDPFSGNGMTLALQSGALAADCAGEYLAGRSELDSALALYAARYRREIEGSFRRVGWVRALLSLPRPAAIAALKMLELPGMGSLLVRKTRASSKSAAPNSLAAL